jgi:5'-3' exonuclease
VPSEQSSRPRLLLLDGHSLAYRAFYALPVENFSTTTGQPTNAVYGFTAMLINVLRDEQPTHVAVAFDVSRETFRSAEFADYKANRAATPDDFRGQVALVKEVLGALRIPVLEAPGYEADDVIATVGTQALDLGYEVLVCTGDRDAFQLITDGLTVLYPKRGVSELSRMTPDAVRERYGLDPAQYPDFAAIRGDPSDNLPNIPGVGEKTAAKWVAQFGSLDELVAHVDEVTGKAGDALRAHLGQVLTNRRLTSLVCDVPLAVGPDDLGLQPWDRDTVHQLFDTLQFRVLRERLYQTLAAPEPEAESGFDVEVEQLAPGALGAWLAEHASPTQRTGVSVHGQWGRGTGRVDVVALATPDGVGVALDPAELGEADTATLAGWLADPQRPKVVHDAKGPLHALAAAGLPLAGLAADTALTAFLALPGQRSYDLSDLVIRFTGHELRNDGDASGQLSLDGGDEQQQAAGEVVKARAVLDLAAALDAEVARRGGRRLLEQVELPLVDVLARMERAGIAVDLDRLSGLEAGFAGQVAQAAQDAYAAIGRDVNLGSPKQLQAVLFDELDMPKTKRTKTGYTTDADALAELYVKTSTRSSRRCCATVTPPGCARRSRACSSASTSTADPHHVQPDDRRHRTAVVHRPEPAEHPGPHRGGSADPGGVRRGPGLRDAADRGLQPDRDADHGAPVRGRGLIDAFTSGGLPRRHGVPGVRGACGRGQPRAARQDQGDELRPGLRAVGVRAVPPADDRGRRGPGPHGRVLRDLRRRPRLPALGRGRGPRDGLHRDDPGPAPVPAGPHQRQPAAPRDGRADGAQRPDPGVGGRHRQGGDAAGRPRVAGRRAGLADAAAGARRARARGGAGEREPLEALVRREMAGAAELSLPLDVSVGVGHSWDEAAH